MKKQGLHRKSVELWPYIILWFHSNVVSPGAGGPPPPLATPLSGAFLPHFIRVI